MDPDDQELANLAKDIEEARQHYFRTRDHLRLAVAELRGTADGADRLLMIANECGSDQVTERLADSARDLGFQNPNMVGKGKGLARLIRQCNQAPRFSASRYFPQHGFQHARGGSRQGACHRGFANACRRHLLWRSRALGHNAQGAQRVQDHRNVDDFLQQSALHRCQITEGGGQHAEHRKSDPGDNAFDGDPPGRPCNRDSRRKTVDAVNQEHDVGSFSRSGGASRPHRHTDVGCCQRGRIVDAVPDHHDGTILALAQNQ
jgi:hypothetical protein